MPVVNVREFAHLRVLEYPNRRNSALYAALFNVLNPQRRRNRRRVVTAGSAGGRNLVRSSVVAREDLECRSRIQELRVVRQELR